MARIDLPSGAWVEYRDKPTLQDRIAVNSVLRFRFEPQPDGTEVRTMTGGSDDAMRIALLTRIITNWSWAPGTPVPSQNTADPADLLASVLDLDDYDTVSEAVTPLFQRVLRPGPKPKAETGGDEAAQNGP
jgi:hypothetical protein